MGRSRAVSTDEEIPDCAYARYPALSRDAVLAAVGAALAGIARSPGGPEEP